MQDIILLNKYKFIWKEKNENVVIAEIRHYLENEYGGTLETPIGTLICYKEEKPIFWRIKILLREDIKFNQTENEILILTKSSYKYKLNYYLVKLKDLIRPRFRAEKELNEEIKNYLLENNWVSEPLSISRLIEKSESFEFIGEIEEFDFT